MRKIGKLIQSVSTPALAALLLNACVAKINFETEYANLPVVNCVLVNDSIQTLSLSRSVKIDGILSYPEIKEAEAILYADDTEVGRFERLAYRNWRLKYTPVSGVSYKLLVRLPDGTELSATTTMPKANYFSSTDQRKAYPQKRFIQHVAEHPTWISVLGDDTQADILHPVIGATASLRSIVATDHPAIDQFNGNETLIDAIPTATLPGYQFYLRIKPQANISEQGISFGIETTYTEFNFVCFRSVSDEYDRYMKSSLQKMFSYRDEDDPIQWFDEQTVYSNIQNGTGVFGAYSEMFIYYYHVGSVAYYDGQYIHHP